MILDCLSLVPWFLSGRWKLLWLVSTNKVIKHFNVVGTLPPHRQVTLLVVGVAFLVHWLACAWKMIGCDWVQELPRSDFSCEDGMSTEVYWACVAQATENLFGGGVSVTPAENAFRGCVSIGSVLINASLFAFLVSMVRHYWSTRSMHARHYLR